MKIKMEFYVGVDVYQAKYFSKSILSANRLVRKKRKSGFEANDWIMDSGGFTELINNSEYEISTGAYADAIRKWAVFGNCVAAVSQDYMCTAEILTKTNGTVESHQQKTIDRFIKLSSEDIPTYLMPVLQGATARDFENHANMYRGLIAPDSWVGVGSIFQQNKNVQALAELLFAIRHIGRDWKLHGFGLKTTALKNPEIRSLLHSADSYAWSYHARKNNRNQNSTEEAELFRRKIEDLIDTESSIQTRLF